MATGIPARLTAAEGRKFGLTVGIAFIVLAALLWWRQRLLVRDVLAGIGVFLVLGGLLVPTALGPLNRAWMGLAHLLSKVTTPIFMGVVYFLVIMPIGGLMRLFRRRPLAHVVGAGGYWKARSDSAEQRTDMTRQF